MKSKGFSLVEILVVLSLLSVVGFGIVSLTTQLGGAVSTNQSRADLLQLTDEFRLVFKDPNVCSSLLLPGSSFDLARASKPAPSDSVPLDGMPIAFRLAGGTLASGQPLATFNLVANKVVMNSAVPAGTVGSNSIYLVSIFGQFSPKTKGLGVRDFNFRQLARGFISVDPSNKIVRCGGDNPATGAAACEVLKGTWTNSGCTLPVPNMAQQVCDIVGGTLSGTKCSLPNNGGSTSSGSGNRWTYLYVDNITAAALPSCVTPPPLGNFCSNTGYKCQVNNISCGGEAGSCTGDLTAYQCL